jgi:hypothetical protein
MYSLYKNEYRNFKPVEVTIRRLRKKKYRGDELIWVIIHIYIDMSEENSLCCYLKQTKMIFFSSTKSENKRAGKILPGCLVPEGQGRSWGRKGHRRVNTMKILGTHVCKWENGTC